MDIRQRRPWLAALAALFLLASGLEAEQGQAVLGPEGKIFMLQNGTYGELFPEGRLAEPENPVLALDVVAASGESQRLLVPETLSPDPEGSTALVYEESTETVYLLWVVHFNQIHPLLNLTSYDGDWGEVIEISSSPFARKGSPQLLVTRDVREQQSASGTEEIDRTIVHMTWWEEVAGNISRKRYAPIVIEDGTYLGWTPVLELSELVSGEESQEPLGTGVSDLLRIQDGKNSHSLILGFTDSRTRRLTALEVDVLPPPLSLLAEKARLQIIEVGAAAPSRGDLALSAGEVVIGLAADFHPATRTHMAERVRAAIAASDVDLDADGIQLLAEKARLQIIEVGIKIGDGGLASTGQPVVLEIGQTSVGGSPHHLLKVTQQSSLPVPDIEAPAMLFLSRSGSQALVVWEAEDRIFYVESNDGEWSETQHVQIGPSFDRETILDMLQQRILTR